MGGRSVGGEGCMQKEALPIQSTQAGWADVKSTGHTCKS